MFTTALSLTSQRITAMLSVYTYVHNNTNANNNNNKLVIIIRYFVSAVCECSLSMFTTTLPRSYNNLWITMIIHVSYRYHYHIIDLKRQNRLKFGTDKPKLKVKMRSVSDDDVRKKTS